MADLVPPAGPVDIAVVGFPDDALDQQMTAALAEVVASGAGPGAGCLGRRKGSRRQVTVIDVDDPADSLELQAAVQAAANQAIAAQYSPTPQDRPPPAVDVVSQLEWLAALQAQGILTSEEFAAQ